MNYLILKHEIKVIVYMYHHIQNGNQYLNNKHKSVVDCNWYVLRMMWIKYCPFDNVEVEIIDNNCKFNCNLTRYF